MGWSSWQNWIAQIQIFGTKHWENKSKRPRGLILPYERLVVKFWQKTCTKGVLA